MMNRKQLLRKLQMLDFAIQETALFLNSHPDDRQAMQYYQSAVNARRLQRSMNIFADH
jgi:spore coat protein JB